MTIERATLVAIPKSVWEEQFAELAKKAERAAVRFKKAPPGDRKEAIRYEGLCRAMEKIVSQFSSEKKWELDDHSVRVLDALDVAAPGFHHPWSRSALDICQALKDECFAGLAEMDGEAILFELRHAFGRGTTPRPQPSGENLCSQNVSDVWKTPSPEEGVFAAITARWRDQLVAAAAGSGTPIVPSGVNNQILSEQLREFVAQTEQSQIDVRVVYRDGSEARPFPLRALRMKEDVDNLLPVLRVSLMSMRHPEMDPTVDAAWLRNRMVSVVRSQAETDQVVYETSRMQLRELTKSESVALHVYQTGLEPAVIGFYRAVTEHLIEKPGSVEVIPYYHQSRRGNDNQEHPEDDYRRGLPWATK